MMNNFSVSLFHEHGHKISKEIEHVKRVWVNQKKVRWILSVSLFQTLKQTHCLFCSWFVRHGSFGLLHAGKTACIAWPSDGGSSKLRPLLSNMENASLLLFFRRLRCRTLLLIFSFFILSFSSVLFLFCSYLTFSVHEFCLDVLLNMSLSISLSYFILSNLIFLICHFINLINVGSTSLVTLPHILCMSPHITHVMSVPIGPCCAPPSLTLSAALGPGRG